MKGKHTFQLKPSQQNIVHRSIIISYMSHHRDTEMCSVTSSEMNGGIMRVRTQKDSLSSSASDLKLRPSTTSTVSLDASQSTSCTCSSVRFSEVHIREYDVTIGDNPSCSHGAPIR